MGGWTKTKLMLFSTQVEVVVELKLGLSLAKGKIITLASGTQRRGGGHVVPGEGQ